MRPLTIAAVCATAIVLLGLSISYGSNLAPSQASIPQVIVVTATPEAGPDLPLEPPNATPSTAQPAADAAATQITTAPPQPPQVVYVQAPPTTIYVQAPPSMLPAPIEVSSAADASTPAPAGPAPSCEIFLSRESLNGWLSTHPEHFGLLDGNQNGVPCDNLVSAAATPAVAEATQTPTSLPTATPTRTPAPTRTPVATSTPVPTATPVLLRGTVVVNFAGVTPPKPTVSLAYTVAPGTNAWQSIQQAIGAGNIQYTDYGGNLGVFITGLFGVNYSATGCSFWEFFVNGVSSSAGVSSYVVFPNDTLEFRTTKFC